MKRFIPLLVLLAAVLACNAPGIAEPDPHPEPPIAERPTLTGEVPPSPIPPTPTVTRPPIATPPQASLTVEALLAQVSPARLFADVEALSAIWSRHLNHPGSAEAAAYIEQAFMAAGVTPQVEVFPIVWEGVYTEQQNVIATLPGRSDRVIVVGAHYDSRTVEIEDAEGRAPGANDNATGVAVLIELARLLAPLELEHTVVLVAFAGEEVGMLGSRYYVSQRDPGDMLTMLAIDTVGNASGEAGAGVIRAFSAPPEGSQARWAARRMLIAGETVPGFTVEPQLTVDRPGRYSDHVPFTDVGVPAVRLIELVEDFGRQHTSEDTPDRISVAYLGQSAQLALAYVAGVALAPEPPPAPTLRDGVLRWEPVQGAAGYLIAARPMDGPGLAWQQIVGPQTTYIFNAVALENIGGMAVAPIAPDGSVGAFSPEVTLSSTVAPR